MRSAFLLLSLGLLSGCGAVADGWQHGQVCRQRVGEFPYSANDGFGLFGQLTKPADVSDQQAEWRRAYWSCVHEPRETWAARS